MNSVILGRCPAVKGMAFLQSALKYCQIFSMYVCIVNILKMFTWRFGWGSNFSTKFIDFSLKSFWAFVSAFGYRACVIDCFYSLCKDTVDSKTWLSCFWWRIILNESKSFQFLSFAMSCVQFCLVGAIQLYEKVIYFLQR